MDSAIVGVVGRLLAIPRFEEQVDVRDRYQEALDAHLQAAELGCRETTSSGPPSQDELSRYGANPKPPSADLLTPGKLLFGEIKGLFSREKPRFFLYSVRRKDEPGREVYVVVDGPIAVSARESVPEAAWELLDRYSDRDEAVEALERLQRGGPARPDDQGTPRTLWAATGCKG